MGAGRLDWTILASAELIGHGATHTDGGADEFSLENLSGSPEKLLTHVALEPDSATKPHDIREVDVTSTSTNKNKCVSNLLAKGWEDHKDNTALHLQAGLITLWTGTLASIPSGWLLCDGGGTRPNLLGKFVVGVPNGSTNPGGTGGASTHTHAAGTYAVANHTHPAGSYAVVMNSGYNPEGGAWSAYQQQGTYPVSGTSGAGGAQTITGTSAAGSSLPPYYVVAFIIKT